MTPPVDDYNVEELYEMDARYLWHPFTQAQGAPTPRLFVRGSGSMLHDAHGHSVIDMISSWWVNLHGHAHPQIANAIAEQANRLEHVLFAGASHPPALQFAQKLINRLQHPLARVFYSDNGSTAVEVALKIAVQYWQNLGTPRNRILAFRGGYHGDTFGAMSAGRGSSFFTPFEPWFFPVDLARYAAIPLTDGDIETEEAQSLLELDHYLAENGATLAACIIEPLVQGAGGMRMARPAYLRTVMERIRATGALVIFDEVFTGFGRTGTMFAYERVGFIPDLLCLSKGITGGFLPLAVTVATENIYEAFLAETADRALLHGHSYTANPLGCAAALASLALFEQEDTATRISTLTATQQNELFHLQENSRLVFNTRSVGTIAAFDVRLDTSQMRELAREMYEDGVFIRPLGSTIYLVPPYCLSPTELQDVYARITRKLSQRL